MRELPFARLDTINEAEFLDFVAKDLPAFIQEISEQGLEKVAVFLKTDLRELLETEFSPKRSELAKNFSSFNKEDSSIVFKRKSGRRNDKGILFLLRFFRWRIAGTAESDEVLIDFRGSTRESTDHLIKQVQEGARIAVTDKMRRAFGATDYPLKKETKHIEIEGRDIDSRLFSRNQDKILKILDKFFFDKLAEASFNQ